MTRQNSNYLVEFKELEIKLSQSVKSFALDFCPNCHFCHCRGKLLLGYTDAELANMGGYHLVHYDDLAYVASAHQECECLRFQLRDELNWFWQTRADALFICSVEDWCQWHDSLQVPEQRGHLAVAANFFQACLQKLKAWFCHQYSPTSHVSI